MGDEQGIVWSILDCEEAEWEKTIRPAGAPATDGQPQAAAWDGTPEPPHAGLRRGPIYRFLACALLLCALCGMLGLRLWQEAEHGVALIKQDIANVVTLETVKAGARLGERGEATQVQAVDFRGDQAMVQVMVTRTAACGAVMVMQQLRFYTRARQGWQRSPPAPAFWGNERELDTPHVHFIYRDLDGPAVVAIAQEAEELETLLQNLLSSQSLTTTGRLTVEVVPTWVITVSTPSADYLALTSPLLQYIAPGNTNTDLLAAQLRYRLVNRAMGSAMERQPVGAQWTPVVEGLRSWLLVSESLPLAQGRLAITEPPITQQLAVPAPRLPWCTRCPWEEAYYGQPYELVYWSAAAQHFIDYVATRYGPATVARLYAGMGIHNNWNDLAPAVFGRSAQALEADWQASIDKSAANP